MFDQLRDGLLRELGAHRTGVLTAGGELGPQAVPVRYRLTGLRVECLLPRWSELAYSLEADPRAVLVVLALPNSDSRWVRCQGAAEPVAAPDWGALAPGEAAPADRYTVVRIRPSRIDLFDQQKGWGARETLDLA